MLGPVKMIPEGILGEDVSAVCTKDAISVVVLWLISNSVDWSFVSRIFRCNGFHIPQP